LERAREAHSVSCGTRADRRSELRSLRVQFKWDSMSAVGAVYDRTFFVDSTKYARSQTAPTVRRLRLFEIESHFELYPLFGKSKNAANRHCGNQSPAVFRNTL